MERLDKLSAYFNEKERKRLSSAVKDTLSGLPVMSREEIKLSCLENNGYESPELNDKLYLHFRGFKKIENLEPYTGCKAIWLDSNGFERIEGLDSMTGLRCLYLSKNLLARIEGLDSLQQLHTLDLSYNRLTMISNLSCCPLLNTINLSRNALATPESIAHLQECLALTTIDLTHNFLEANAEFISVIQGIPAMTTLSINGNDVTKVSHFRKLMIANIPRLGYLDRPVEELEKIGAQAFVEGGADAELAARNAYRESLREKKAKEMADFKLWQAEQRKQRAIELAEGRAKILQLSEEEIAEKAREAKEAAEAERKMLEMGIDQVASRYWKLEGSADSRKANSLDVLDEATRQLVREHGFGAPVAAGASIEELPDVPTKSSSKIEIIESDGESEEEPAPVIPPPPPTAEELKAEIERAAREEMEKVKAEAQAALDREEAERQAAIAREEEQRLAEQLKREKAEERERQQRVADSLRIYKEQLAAEKRAKEAKSKGLAGSSAGATAGRADDSHGKLASEIEREWASTGSTTFASWESAAAALCSDNRAADVFYWTEAMDMRLAQEVRKCVFDFESIARQMQSACMAGGFGADRYATIIDPGQFTAEACRLRWAQLDAEQWCQAAPDAQQNEAVYKVCISPEVLSAGHGNQPTFEALSRMSSGQSSSYFKAPTVFPTVRDDTVDDEDDDDDDEDREGEIVAVNRTSPSAKSIESEEFDEEEEDDGQYGSGAEEVKDSELNTSHEFEELD